MQDFVGPHAPGAFEARYLAFLETVKQLRPGLHRYCSRMTGSVMDGEDIVQEALFHAYRRLDTYDDSLPLSPWLFRIAHNRCVDFLRRREVRHTAEAAALEPDSVAPVEPMGSVLGLAVEHLVLALPPMERACVLLKDVLDYSLEEIAQLVDSTTGGVKSALNRGRSKLSKLPPPQVRQAVPNPAVSELLQLYVQHFNRRDWHGLRELISADARLLVADRFAGPLIDAPYFSRYERLSTPWRLIVGDVDGEPSLLALREHNGVWNETAIRVEIAGDRIVSVVDYTHCPWVLPASMHVSSSPPTP